MLPDATLACEPEPRRTGVTRSPAVAPPVAGRMPGAVLLLGLAAILLANFVTRRYLEPWDHVSYFSITRTFDDPELRAQPWRVLLPINLSDGQYCWCTTGAVIVTLLENALSPRTAFCLLNAILIVTTFAASWIARRSAVFTVTMTLCMAFGTQFHYAFALSSIFAFYLFIAYLEVNLLCAYKLVHADGGGRGWYAGYAVSLVITVLCHETWLNYYVFLVLSAALFLAVAWRHGAPLRLRPVLFVVGTATLLALVYIPVRAHVGRQHFRPGAEDELITGYPYPLLAGEDFLSNEITYVYMALTNFLPPVFGSNSDYFIGPEAICREQHGYHAAQGQLVAMHHLFYWRYFAGAVFLAFVYGFARVVRAAWRQGPGPCFGVAALCILIAAGCATHLLIKYRPYMSVPSLSYKCLISIVGVALLTAYLLTLARGTGRRSRWYAALVLTCWTVIVASGYCRPPVLGHLNQRVGLRGYPSAMQGLLDYWQR